MNFPLAEVELHLDESCLVQGEWLLEQGRVGHLLETERHLWLTEVQDGTAWEVEMRISPSKVQQASCECAAFRADKQCAHLAAALLALRRLLTDRQAEKQAARAQKKERPARSLDTQSILNNVRPDDLADFVRQYARSNRAFAVALKTRFASEVPALDNKAKFSELLDSAVGMARKADNSISYRGAGKIASVADEMLAQARQATALRHWADAADMAQSIIEKLTPLLRKAGERQVLLRESIRQAFQVLFDIPVTQAPPDLTDGLWNYAAEESKKLLYRNNELDRPFFRLLAALCTSPDKDEELRVLLSAQIDRYLSENRDPSALVLLQLNRLEHLGREIEARQLVETYLSAPDVLLFAVQQAAGREDYQQMVMLAEEGLRRNPPPHIAAELEERLLLDAVRRNDMSKVSQLARTRYYKTLEIKYYQALRTATARPVAEEVLEYLRKLPFSPRKRQAIAGVLSEEGRREELLAYLRECRSPELLAEFGPLLLPEKSNDILELYRLVLEQYLRGHVGPKPSQRIRQMVEQLYAKGAASIAEPLVAMIREAYPERHTLQEELQHL